MHVRVHHAPSEKRPGPPPVSPDRYGLAGSGLALGPPDGRHEREADRAAEDALVGARAGGLSRLSDPSATTGPVQTDALRVAEVLARAGEPIEPATRRFFAAAYGDPLSDVRVHADGAAARSARALRAEAYTAGRHVVLGERAAREGPGPSPVLAHELAHVVQMRAGATFTGATEGALPVLRQVESGTGLPSSGGTSDLREAVLREVRDVLSLVGGSPFSKPAVVVAPDAVVEWLAATVARLGGDRMGRMMVVLENVDGLRSWLGPFGFRGTDRRSLTEDFDAALARWRAASPHSRDLARRTYFPVAHVPEGHERQVVAGELPDGSQYEGSRADFRRESGYAVGLMVQSKIQGVTASGPISLLGRAVGTAFGGERGGEIGAAIGAGGDLVLPVKARNVVRNQVRAGGGGASSGGRPPRPAEVAATLPDPARAQTARPGELARTARPEELAKTAPALGGTQPTGAPSNPGSPGATDTLQRSPPPIPGAKSSPQFWDKMHSHPRPSVPSPSVPVTVGNALRSLERDPASVVVHATGAFHQWVWSSVLGHDGRAPVAFTHGYRTLLNAEGLSAPQLVRVRAVFARR